MRLLWSFAMMKKMCYTLYYKDTRVLHEWASRINERESIPSKKTQRYPTKDVLRKTPDLYFVLLVAWLDVETCHPCTDSSCETKVIEYGRWGIMFEQAGRLNVTENAVPTVDDDIYKDDGSHMLIRTSFDKTMETFSELPCPFCIFITTSTSPRNNMQLETICTPPERSPPFSTIIRDALVEKHFSTSQCSNEQRQTRQITMALSG